MSEVTSGPAPSIAPDGRHVGYHDAFLAAEAEAEAEDDGRRGYATPSTGTPI